MTTTVVLGIGNELLCDEGVGVHTIRKLMKKNFGPQVVLAEIGTAILDALPFLEIAKNVIIIDAVVANEQSGSIYKFHLTPDDSPQVINSMHGFDLARCLYLTRRHDQPKIMVVGIEPDRLDWSLKLSPKIHRQLPLLIKTVENEIYGLNNN